MQISQLFKEDTKKWILIDNEIKKANNAVRLLKKEKDAIGEKMITYIKNNNMEDQQFNIAGNKIKLATSKTSAPVNREHIETRLTEYYKSSSKAKEVTEFIYVDREKTEKEYLSRTRPKGGD